MSQPEFMTGEELRSEFSAICGGTPYSAMPAGFQLNWDAFAARIKCPRPKVPTLVETWSEWASDESASVDEAEVERLRQRLNAAHAVRASSIPTSSPASSPAP